MPAIIPFFRQSLDVFAGFDTDRHGLIDLLDGLLVLPLYLGQGISVVIPLSKSLVPLSYGLKVVVKYFSRNAQTNLTNLSTLLLELVSLNEHVLILFFVPNNFLLKLKVLNCET